MSTHTNPFEILGLPARRDLTDDQVDAAWRKIAMATHPDRPDGGLHGVIDGGAGSGGLFLVQHAGGDRPQDRAGIGLH